MLKAIFKKVIRGYYLLISPWLGNRCRFVPSCSEYATQAIDQHGVMQGIFLTGKRVCRCHPWGEHGFDPVPQTKNNLSSSYVSSRLTNINDKH